MFNKLSKIGKSKATRIELLIVLLLVVIIPFSILNNKAVLGEQTANLEAKPSPTVKPSPKPNQGSVARFSVSMLCGNDKYKAVTYACVDGRALSANEENCKTIGSWYSLAREKCKKADPTIRPIKPSISPTRKPSVSPRPSPSLRFKQISPTPPNEDF